MFIDRALTESSNADSSMDDDVPSTSVKDMIMKLTPKKLTLKRTFVYVCDMDNIYRARKHIMIRLLKIKEIENPLNDNGKSQFTTKTPGELRLHKGVDDDVPSTSVKDMFMKLTPKKLTLKRTFVYVCDMDNIYRARRRLFIDE
ncbi:hypothetical protein LXL04_029324 [Taraxacum kok-saghyz]